MMANFHLALRKLDLIKMIRFTSDWAWKTNQISKFQFSKFFDV